MNSPSTLLNSFSVNGQEKVSWEQGGHWMGQF